MAVRVWHYKGCDTCRKALRWLKERDVAFEAIDLVVDTPPDAATLAKIQRLAGVPARKLFNTHGLIYVGEGWAEKSAGWTDAQIHEALAGNGRLIKRPLLLVERDDGSAACVGFVASEWQRIFG